MVGMTLFWRKTGVIVAWLLFLLPCSALAQTPAAAWPAAGKTTQASGHKRTKSKPSPVPAQVTPPTPAPLTPEQMPPAAPQVTYRDGLLTIVASNSTLSDILRAVAARTGASLDAPAQLTVERVAVHLGPASPREVLSDLLTGPRLDYILVGSDGDPNGVRSIILSANQASPSASVAMAQPPPAPLPAEEEEEDDQVAPQPEIPQPGRFAQQPSPGRRPFMQPQPPDQVGGQPTTLPEGGNQQQPVKTPEQLLEQLRRMQQQQPGNPQQPQTDAR
jgi:hypothetical protein